ncbi:MAG: hypothetical protein E7342_04545 [Clostridiales bacterium]|nr:hypothetical protein [Clostridiales bacterium]
MKKILTVAVAALLTVSSVSFATNTLKPIDAEVIAVSDTFDENNIAISFGAISDVHIQKNSYAEKDGDYCLPYFRQALDSLITQANVHDKDGLDAVLVAGDLTEVNVGETNQAGRNTRSAAEINAFTDVVYEYRDTSIGTNFITTPGNHDWRGIYTRDLQGYYDLFGRNYFTDSVADGRKEYRLDLERGYRHTSITKGTQEFHFIVLQPYFGHDSDDKIVYAHDPVVLDYLETDLNAITTRNPNAYVYVVTHVAPVDTARGSEYEWRNAKNFLSEGLMKDPEDAIYSSRYNQDYTYTDINGVTKTIKVNADGRTVRRILPNYPQVMTFAGHSHCPLNEERSIWQGDFTALSTASSKYTTDYPDDKYISNTISLKTSTERNRGGLLVQVDVNGNVRITRVNFSRNYLVDKSNLVIKDVWELEAPKADKSHLNKYSRATRVANNEAPVMSGAVTLTAGTFSNLYDTADTTVFNVKLSAPAATDDDYNIIAYYNIKVYKAGTSTLVKSYTVRSDLMYADINKNENTLRKTFEYLLKLNAGSYDVKIQAVDEWDAVSNWLTSTITVA